MHYHTTAYNTFALSTLSYIAQLERPPPETLTAEKQGLKKIIKGPNLWIEPADLWRLGYLASQLPLRRKLEPGLLFRIRNQPHPGLSIGGQLPPSPGNPKTLATNVKAIVWSVFRNPSMGKVACSTK